MVRGAAIGEDRVGWYDRLLLMLGEEERRIVDVVGRAVLRLDEERTEEERTVREGRAVDREIFGVDEERTREELDDREVRNDELRYEGFEYERDREVDL